LAGLVFLPCIGWRSLSSSLKRLIDNFLNNTMKYLQVIIFFLSNFCYSQNFKSFKNGEIELFYEEHGKGPALYILTGGPGAPPDDPSVLMIDSLKSFYTCVVLHQRGAGRSRNIPINSQTINIKSYVQDVELLRQKRKDKKIVLAGISWGGLLAMNYTALYPQYVSKLVLICSAPPSYKVWNVLEDNQHVRRSVSELDSMNALIKIFSVKTDRELDSLKQVDPYCKEVIAFKRFIAIHVRAMFYDRNKLPANFDSLFIKFNFQPIPLIDKEVLDTKWDITAALKKLNVPASNNVWTPG
jgi:proline iminopeptidase